MTWSEAIERYRAEKLKAEKRKEARDEVLWQNLEDLKEYFDKVEDKKESLGN